MKNHAFKDLIINLLDDPHGIDQSNFEKLVEFSDRNYPDLLTDVFNAVDGADDRVWLDEGISEELRTKQ